MFWIVASLVVVLVAAVLVGRWLVLDRQRRTQPGPLAQRLEDATRAPGAADEKGLI